MRQCFPGAALRRLAHADARAGGARLRFVGRDARSKRPATDEPLLRTTGPALSAEQASAVAAIDAAADASRPSCSMASPAAARPRCTCTRWSTRCAAGGVRWCWCPRSASPRSWWAAFASASRCTVAVLHSGLTDTERLAAWRECVSGAARIVLGTRSAVFAPVADLGIDHRRRGARRVVQAARERLSILGARSGHPARATRRGTHRAGLGHALARDPAQRRRAASTRACRCRAAPGRRCRRAPRSSICASTRCAPASRRRRSRPCNAISPTAARCWCSSTGAVTRRRWPAPPAAGLRPAATAMRASPCTWPRSACAAITAARTRRCPRSARNAATPCAMSARAPSGSRRRWQRCSPACPIARLDRDVVRRRGDLESVVSRIASGEARILVGTQMVTKGHDFPSVTLVVVLNADQGSVQHRLPRTRARGADHHPGGGARRARHQTRRSADPDRIPGTSAARQPARPRATTASPAPRSRNAPPRAGRRSRMSPHCAHRPASLATASEFLRQARKLARAPGAAQVVRTGAGRDDQARRRATTRSCCWKRANARRCTVRWTPGCRRSRCSRRRATCAGRWTWIRWIFSSEAAARCAIRRSRAFSSPRRRELRRKSVPRWPASTAGGGEAAWRTPSPEAGAAAVTGICHSPSTRQASPAVSALRKREAAAVMAIARHGT